jgi:hypothetical protein
MKSVTLPRQARVKHKLERFACRHNDCGSQVATGIFESYLKMRGVSGVRICQVSTKRKSPSGVTPLSCLANNNETVIYQDRRRQIVEWNSKTARVLVCLLASLFRFAVSALAACDNDCCPWLRGRHAALWGGVIATLGGRATRRD